MNYDNASTEILESMIQRTAISWNRIAMRAPYLGQKRRAEQFARRVRLPRFSVNTASLISESLRPLMVERRAA